MSVCSYSVVGSGFFCFRQLFFFSFLWLCFSVRWFCHFFFCATKNSLKKVKTSRKAEQYQNNSHLSCFEKWLKIFCKAFSWSLVVGLCERIKRGENCIQTKLECRLMPMGQLHHWNRIAFFYEIPIESERWQFIQRHLYRCVFFLLFIR